MPSVCERCGQYTVKFHDCAEERRLRAERDAAARKEKVKERVSAIAKKRSWLMPTKVLLGACQCSCLAKHMSGSTPPPSRPLPDTSAKPRPTIPRFWERVALGKAWNTRAKTWPRVRQRYVVFLKELWEEIAEGTLSILQGFALVIRAVAFLVLTPIFFVIECARHAISPYWTAYNRRNEVDVWEGVAADVAEVDTTV